MEKREARRRVERRGANRGKRIVDPPAGREIREKPGWLAPDLAVLFGVPPTDLSACCSLFFLCYNMHSASIILVLKLHTEKRKD